MTWEELRDRVVAALGEFDQAAPATSTSATFNNSVIYQRLTESYRLLVSKAARLAPAKFTSRQTFTYAANSESISLAAATNPSLRHRKVIRLEDYTDADLPLTIRQATERQWRRWLDEGDYGDCHYLAYFEGDLFHLAPKPTSALTIRAAYIPLIAAINAGTADVDTPDLFPEEHHAVIAINAAVSLQPHGAPASLLEERARMERELFSAISESRQGGARYVHEE